MAKKKDFSNFEETSGISAFISQTFKEEEIDEKKDVAKIVKNKNDKSANKTEKLTLYLTPDQSKMIDYVARLKGMTKSKLLMNIIIKEMEKPSYERAYRAMQQAEKEA